MRANSLGERGSRFHNVSLQQMHAGSDHTQLYVTEQIRTFFPPQHTLEGSEPIRELASQTGIIPLRQVCVQACTYTHAHTNTHQGSTQGWAAIPLRSPLDDIHIRRYWTQSHGGGGGRMRCSGHVTSSRK